MTKIIQTKDKDDIVTGFDVEVNIDLYDRMYAYLSDEAKSLYSKQQINAMVDSVGTQWVDLANQWINDGVTIFYQEATLSIWSGNLSKNAIVGISGSMPKYNKSNNEFTIDLRIGVNANEIGNPANWTSRASKRPSRKNASPVIYEFNGRRMKPGIDYSQFLEDGSAHQMNPAISSSWEGFVERAEARFSALW